MIFILRFLPFRRESDLLNKRLKAAFEKIKEELEDHLETINDNTNEIQANYEFLCKLEKKIDKLNEKVEQLQMLLVTAAKVKENITVEPLTAREQEVFLALYTSDVFMKYSDIARNLGLTEGLVKNYVTNIIEKGVPIIKKYQHNETFLMLEPVFKNLQTKKNVLKINESIIKQFHNDRLMGIKLKDTE